MICLRDNQDGADLLIGYLEATLPDETRRELEVHTAGCAECREMLAVQATLDEFVPPSVSPDFDRGVYARIEEERTGQWWRTPWKLALPAALAAALAVGVWIERPVAPAVDNKQAAVEFDMQQLEQELEDLELLTPLSGSVDRM